MHVDFIHNQRNTKNCMADGECLGQNYISVDKLCIKSLSLDIGDETNTGEAKYMHTWPA